MTTPDTSVTFWKCYGEGHEVAQSLSILFSFHVKLLNICIDIITRISCKPKLYDILMGFMSHSKAP